MQKDFCNDQKKPIDSAVYPWKMDGAIRKVNLMHKMKIRILKQLDMRLWGILFLPKQITTFLDDNLDKVFKTKWI